LLLFVGTGVVYAATAQGDPFTDSDPLSMAFRLLKSVGGWLWVVAILGLARSRMPPRRRAPARTVTGQQPGRASMRRLGACANDAVLPFYVLHETVIVVVAYFILTWPIGAGAQYLLISLTSLAATLLLYDLGVRRTSLTRYLFGLKPTGSALRSPTPQGS
jgi:glucans biosynthesis protein C